MDIEQLKLILEAVSRLGEAGHSAFVWWLVLDKVLPFLFGVFAFILIAYMIQYITRLVSGINHLNEVASELGIYVGPGLSPEDLRQLAQKTMKLIYAAKE